MQKSEQLLESQWLDLQNSGGVSIFQIKDPSEEMLLWALAYGKPEIKRQIAKQGLLSKEFLEKNSAFMNQLSLEDPFFLDYLTRISAKLLRALEEKYPEESERLIEYYISTLRERGGYLSVEDAYLLREKDLLDLNQYQTFSARVGKIGAVSNTYRLNNLIVCLERLDKNDVREVLEHYFYRDPFLYFDIPDEFNPNTYETSALICCQKEEDIISFYQRLNNPSIQTTLVFLLEDSSYIKYLHRLDDQVIQELAEVVKRELFYKLWDQLDDKYKSSELLFNCLVLSSQGTFDLSRFEKQYVDQDLIKRLVLVNKRYLKDLTEKCPVEFYLQIPKIEETYLFELDNPSDDLLYAILSKNIEMLTEYEGEADISSELNKRLFKAHFPVLSTVLKNEEYPSMFELSKIKQHQYLLFEKDYPCPTYLAVMELMKLEGWQIEKILTLLSDYRKNNEHLFKKLRQSNLIFWLFEEIIPAPIQIKIANKYPEAAYCIKNATYPVILMAAKKSLEFYVEYAIHSNGPFKNQLINEFKVDPDVLFEIFMESQRRYQSLELHWNNISRFEERRQKYSRDYEFLEARLFLEEENLM